MAGIDEKFISEIKSKNNIVDIVVQIAVDVAQQPADLLQGHHILEHIGHEFLVRIDPLDLTLL